MVFNNPLWATFCLLFSTIATILAPVVGSPILAGLDRSQPAERAITDPYCANSPVLVRQHAAVRNRNGVITRVLVEVNTLVSDVCLCVQGGQFTATSQSDLQRLYTSQALTSTISTLAVGAITAEERTVTAVQRNITDCTLGTTCVEGIVSFPCDCLNDSKR
jgi:hypothetical protein